MSANEPTPPPQPSPEGEPQLRRSASIFGDDRVAAPAPAVATNAPGPGLLIFVRLLLLGALGVSAYLLWFALSGKAVPGCDPDAGCGRVLSSRYASWLGMPVSLPAIGVDLLALVLTASLGSGATAAGRRRAWSWLLVLAPLLVLAAAWFILVQAMLLKEFCPYCLVAHACGALAGLTLLAQAPLGGGDGSAETGRLPLSAALSGTAIAALLIGALVAGQVLVKPAPTVVKAPPRPAPSTTTDAPGRGDTDSGPGAKRAIFLLGGKVRVEPTTLPNLGDTSRSKHVFLYVFDYTCPACQAMHRYLDEARVRFGDQIAVAALPSPLSHHCNPSMKSTSPRHEEACDFALLSMAVWVADATKWEGFHHWLLKDELGLPLHETAKRKAAELVGAERLEKAISSGEPGEMIVRGGKVYELGGRGPLPRVIWPGAFVSGGPDTADEFCDLIEKELKLQRVGKPLGEP